MATSTVPWYYDRNQSSTTNNGKTTENHNQNNVRNNSKIVNNCQLPIFPTNFPKKFQDFFGTLNEDIEDLPTMLEEKLIPRKEEDPGSNNKRWAKRNFQRRSSEIEVRQHRSCASGAAGDATTTQQGQNSSNPDGIKSPTTSRRRSSSIALARPKPDLHRFLQAEAGPWGHLSPSPRSPTRNLSLSPGGHSSGTHLTPSPAGPSPTSPGIPTSKGVRSNSLAATTSNHHHHHHHNQQKHRGRTSSMPAVPRHKPALVDAKRYGTAAAANGNEEPTTGPCTEDGVEYYRLRSFSITANGVFNLGDSLKSRRSRSNSVASSSTSCSSTTRDARLLSSASQISGIETGEDENRSQSVTYKVGMLGSSGVGKTALTAQFTTSEYICAYDASLDDEYGQKSVSVMIDGQETELEIIDHPASEMSVESFLATYNPDVCVVVYSVVEMQSFKFAEETLLYLWESDYMAKHGVILVGNKVDLQRKREVPASMGCQLANSCVCKFIETSSGLAHHVDELLVGILAQIKLNPQRDRDQSTRRKRSKSRRKLIKSLLGFKRKTKSCENLFVL